MYSLILNLLNRYTVFHAISDLQAIVYSFDAKKKKKKKKCIYVYIYICNIYNMSGRVVSDIQTRAEGESLYI